MSPRKFTGVFIDRNSCFKKKAHVPVYRDFPFGCGLNAPLLSSQDVIAARKKARAAAAALTKNEVTIPSQKINSLPPIQGPKPFHSSPNVGTDLRVQKGKFRVAGKPHGVSTSCTSPQSGNGFRVKRAAGKLKLVYVNRSTQVPGQESRVDDARSRLPSTQKKHNMAVQSRAPATQHNVLVNSAALSQKIVVPPSIRVKVKQALRSFQFLCRKYLPYEEARLKGPVGGSSSHLRVDTMAAKTLRNSGMYVNTGDQIIGVVPGVDVGDHFHYRIELCIVGLHRQIQAGIDFLKSRNIATSIVVSGCYEDDIDEGEVLEYTGHGGNNYSGNKKQSTDQKLERGNLALANSYSRRIPVRVIRGFKERKIGRINVQSTYTYDGLYDVERYWVEAGQSGFKVYKFRLRRQPNQPKLASGTVTFLGKKSEISYKKSLVMEDLARGKENVSIKVYNDVDNDRPPRFEYAKSIKYPPSLKPKLHKGCSCRDACHDPTKCRCARKNGGEFPYNYDGALVLIKNLVYECGPDCSCPSYCPNRISQHGIQLSLQLFKTEKKGWGVRSPESINAGSFICEYVGDILTNDEEAGRHVGTDEYLFDIGRGNDEHEHSLWADGFSELLVSEGLCQRKNVTGGGMNSVEDAGFTVDAARRGSIGRLINHSCSPNLDAQNVLFDHDDRRLPHVMFFAVENIPPMVELCYSYNCPVNQVVSPTGTAREKPCYCGSSNCKRRLY